MEIWNRLENRHSPDRMLVSGHLCISKIAGSCQVYRGPIDQGYLYVCFWRPSGPFPYTLYIVMIDTTLCGLNSMQNYVDFRQLWSRFWLIMALFQTQLHSWISGNVSSCERSLFIFDEIDKFPTGLLDTVKGYLEHYPKVDGLVYRKTIFIFIGWVG